MDVDSVLANIADKADLHRIIDAMPDDAKIVIVSNKPLDYDELKSGTRYVGVRGFGTVTRWEARGLLDVAMQVVREGGGSA